MIENKDEYQQQILFDESENINAGADINTAEHPEEQYVFDNNDWQPVEAQEYTDDNNSAFKQQPNWLWRAVFSLFSVIVVIEAVSFFKNGFSESPLIASVYAALFVCLLFIVSTVIFKELSGLRQLKKRQKVQQDIANIRLGESNASVVELCQSISDKLPGDLDAKQQQQWADIASSEHNDKELLTLYSRVVLTKVDQKAVAEISKYSSESVVLIALSPVAIIDMLIMVWRNLRMIDKIAALYGLKLGYWSRIRLIKQVFVNMVYAGASELVVDLGADMLGAEVLGKLSGRLAQGLGAGLLTARLGLKTVVLCRPLAFEENAPRMGDIRRDILAKLKALTTHKST